MSRCADSTTTCQHRYRGRRDRLALVLGQQQRHLCGAVFGRMLGRVAGEHLAEEYLG